MDVGVDIDEICVRWDRNYDFSNHVKSYIDGTDVVSISEVFENFSESEVDCTLTRTDIQSSRLKPSQMIAYGVIVQAAV